MERSPLVTTQELKKLYFVFVFEKLKFIYQFFSDLYYWMRWRGHQELPCHWDCRNSGCLPCLKVKVKITNVFLLLFSNYNKNQLKRNQLSPKKKISSKISALYSRFWKKVTCKSILGIGKTTVWFFSVEILFRTFGKKCIKTHNHVDAEIVQMMSL